MRAPAQHRINSQALTEVSALVGKTPLVQIRGIHRNPNVKIFAKLEYMQFGQSIQARPVNHLFQHLIQSDRLDTSLLLVDAAQVNTAIAYSAFSAAAGLRAKLFVPESVDPRLTWVQNVYGTELVHTPSAKGIEGARRLAERFLETNTGAHYFANLLNSESAWLSHYETTAEEIFTQTFGTVTHFVSGLSGGGTFTGTVRRLREYNKKIQAIALQPETVLHGISDWQHVDRLVSTGLFDPKLANDTLRITTRAALDLALVASRKTGFLLSVSSAANLAGAIQVAESIDHGVVVTLFPDQVPISGDLDLVRNN